MMMKGLSLCFFACVLLFSVEGKNKKDWGDQPNSPDTVQRQALESLYYAADGENWRENDNWMDRSLSVCDWYGITCDGAAVTKLILDDNYMAGGDDALPTLLGNLYGLQHLHLAGNHRLFTYLPTEIGNMQYLTYINFSNCWNLDGEIPREFGRLSALETLDLREVGLEGDVPWEDLADLNNLRYLDFKGSGFEGIISYHVGRLEELIYFNVVNNHFNGEIPSEMGNLVHLKHLELYGNYFSGSLPTEIGQLVNLKIFDFGNNYISGTLPSELSHLTSGLERISGFRNQLTGLFPEFLCSGNFEWCFEDNEWLCPLPKCADFDPWGQKHGCGPLECDSDDHDSWDDDDDWDDSDSDYYDDSDSDYYDDSDDSDPGAYPYHSYGGSKHHSSSASSAIATAAVIIGSIFGMFFLIALVLILLGIVDRSCLGSANGQIQTGETETPTSWWALLGFGGSDGFNKLDEEQSAELVLDEETGKEWMKADRQTEGDSRSSLTQADGFVTYIADPFASSSGQENKGQLQGGRDGEGAGEDDELLKEGHKMG